MGLKDLRKIADRYDKKATFNRNVPTMVDYRNNKGERIGIPAPPPVDDIMTGLGGSDNDVSGPLAGFGNYLLQQGHTMDEIRAAGRTELPEGDTDVAEQDLAPDRTPGGGTELDDEYGLDEIEANRRVARRTISQWEEDVEILKTRLNSLILTAQRLEDNGQIKKAQLFDRKAIKLAREIKALEAKINARKNYENDMRDYEDMTTGIMPSDELL